MVIKFLFSSLLVLEFSFGKEKLKRITTSAELSEIKEKSDQLNCILYTAPQYCSKCQEYQDAFTKSFSKVAKFAKFYLLNCESFDEPTESQFCTLSGRKILPKIACYHTPKYSIDPYTQKELPADEKIYFGKEKVDSIVEFIRNSVPSYFMEIKNENDLARYQKDKSFAAKLYLYTTASMDTLVELKSLSLYFKDRIGFARIISPKLMASLGYSNTKSILFLELKGEKTLYEGDLKSLIDLRNFISPHVLPEKIVQKFVDPDSLSLLDTGNIDYLTLVSKYSQDSLEEIMEHDRFVLVHIHRKGKDADFWMDIIQRFGTMIVYYDFEIETEENESHARQVLEVNEYPSLRLYRVGDHKSHPKVIYKGNIDPDDLAKDILDFIYDNSMQLFYKNSAKKLGEVMQREKHSVIYFSEKERISPAYKYISNLGNFTKDMIFFHVVNPSKEFLEGYGVPSDQRPAIVVLQLRNEVTPFNNSNGGKSYSNDIKAHIYVGEMSYGGIKGYLIPVSKFLLSSWIHSINQL